MLWSLIKILIFVGVTAALAYAGGLLMESDGMIRLTAFGTEFTLGPLQAAIFGVVVVFAIWFILLLSGLLLAVIRFVNGDETAISRYFDRNRERRGFEALAEGMMALASGEGRLAMAKAARAEKYLGRPELTNLLTAQAAEIAGDRSKAEEVYKRLLQDDRTRFVGVRGIMKQKLADGDTDTALELAERAFALKPRHEETTDILLRLQAGKGDWTGARRTLGAKLRSGALPRDVHRRRDAVLALSEAQAGDGEDETKAQTAAIDANRLSPDLVPAAVAAARAFVAQGRARQATKVIRKAWEAAPHPDLAAAFAAIEPDETAVARIKRFDQLTKLHPDHPEVKQLNAELHLAAQDFEAARAALGDLVETDANTRTLALMAAIERGSGGDDALVRGWLTRAVAAPRGPQWVCDNCQSVHSAWAPVCSNCEGLDTLTWRRPPDDAEGTAGGTEMLAALVSAQTADAPDEARLSVDEATSTDDGPPEVPSDPIVETASPADDTDGQDEAPQAPFADFAPDEGKN
jgi:HemY protein